MRTLRRLSFVLALIAYWALHVISDAPAQNPAADRPKLPQGFAAEYDVKYVEQGDPAQALDIYFPERPGDQPLPLVIWIHGGGWSAGNKSHVPFANQLLRGYVVASLEYRFSQNAKFPAQIQDCQAAIRWLRGNAKKYGIDPARIGVGGGSAGGHLSALIGTSGGKNVFPKIGGHDDESDRVQAVLDIFGPTDFWTVVAQSDADKSVKSAFKWNDGDPYSQLIGARLGEDKAKCDAVSPVRYVTADNPPFLILHGDRDALVPYAQSVELSELLVKAGVPVILQRIPGAGHGGPGFNLPAVNELTNSFFDKYLKGKDLKLEPLPEEAVTPKAAATPNAK